jgi:SAM-dependent methyltransferase
LNDDQKFKKNLDVYSDGSVVAHYARENDLQPCEEKLFGRWLRPGMRVLDLGVGGGRTTPVLARDASRYVGVDFSQAMVDACRTKFPQLEFHRCDATDLGKFSAGEFDLVTFSFNGVDYISSDDARSRCFSEVARVLSDDGVFIFSSHHARMMARLPQFRGANLVQMVWRVAYATFRSPRFALGALTSAPFYKGRGYILDPTHGGLHTYVSTPATMIPQLNSAGFDVVEVCGGDWPTTEAPLLTPWYYYACTLSKGTTSE